MRGTKSWLGKKGLDHKGSAKTASLHDKRCIEVDSSSFIGKGAMPNGQRASKALSKTRAGPQDQMEGVKYGTVHSKGDSYHLATNEMPGPDV